MLPSKGLLADEIPHFYQKISSFASELHDHTLQMDHELIMNILEREKDGRILSLPEHN